MKYTAVLIALLSFVAAFSFATPQAQAVGPWTKSFGEYYLKVGSNFYRADGYRTASGTHNDDTPYSNFTNYTFAQIGLWDDLHLQFYVPLEYARLSHQEREPESGFGFGDTMISLQASPLDLDIPTSIRLEARLPLYRYDLEAPPPGEFQVDYALWLSAGGGLHSREIPLYYSLDVGYMHRSKTIFTSRLNDGRDLSDAFVSHAQVGYTVQELFDVNLGASAQVPFEMGTFDEAFITVGPSIYWPVTDLVALEMDGYYTPYARNSGQGWSIGAGISFSRDQY